VMSSFWIKILINRITVNNQREKQIMLQLVQKIFYLLEGNLMASDRAPERLQSHQSVRMGLSIKDLSTIQSRWSLQQGEHIHHMNSVLTRYFWSPASLMNSVSNSGSNGLKRCCHPLTVRRRRGIECGASIAGRWQRAAMIFMVIVMCKQK
jgi:hypothetical protein